MCSYFATIFMRKIKPNDAFEQVWNESMRAEVAVEVERNPQYALFKKRPGFIELQVCNLKGLFVERRKVERALFFYLRDVLRSETELIDFLSGDAVATTPMLLTGDLRKLHLLDDGHSPKQKAVSELLTRRLEVHSGVQWHHVTLSATTPLLNLPSVKAGVLADSGIALPARNRMPRSLSSADIQSPSTFRGAHVMEPTVTLPDVLRVFGGMRGRTLHVVETPFFRVPLSLNDWGDHLLGQLSEGTPWSLDELEPLLEETGTMRATFKTA
jgi:hypothetical protein